MEHDQIRFTKNFKKLKMNKSYKQVKICINYFCNEWIKSVAMRTFQGNCADRNVKTTSRTSVNGRFHTRDGSSKSVKIDG